MCELRLDSTVEETLEPVDDIAAKPPFVEFVLAQPPEMVIIAPFIFEPSLMIAADICKRALTLRFCRFFDDVVPVTLVDMSVNKD